MGEGVVNDKVKSRKEKEKQVKMKEKLVDDIVKAAKREKFGFPEEKLRPAVNSLIETYGIDDAYTWITKDNFAVLVNELIESPCKGKDGCSSPIHPGEKVHGKHHDDQVTVRHSVNETGSRPMQSASNASEQRSLRKVSEQRSLRNTHSVSNDTQNKHQRDEHLSDSASKSKKLKPNRSYADCKPNYVHARKKLIEQDNSISPIIIGEERLNGVSSRERKLPPTPSDSSSAMSREKECNTSKKIIRSLQMHESIGILNANASSDAELSFRERATDKIRISKSDSNVSSKDHISTDTLSVIPLLKDNELRRRKTSNDEGHAFEKQISLIHKCDKSSSVLNPTNVEECQRMRSKNLRNSSDRQGEVFKMTSKVHSVGIAGNAIETGEGKTKLHENSRKSINKQTHSTEEVQLTKTSREHFMKKVKEQNDYALAFVEREKSSFISCRIPNEDIKTRSKDQRKPVSNQQSTPSKDWAGSLKEHHASNVEDLNEQLLLPNIRMNNIIRSVGPNKPNKNDVYLPLQNANYVLGLPNVKDSQHLKKEAIEEKVCSQFCSLLLRELKVVARGWVKTSNGLLKTDISSKAVDFFLQWKVWEWKKSLQSRKGKAVLHPTDNVQDHSFQERGTSKTDEVAQVRKKKNVSLSDQADADGVLLSLDISRGLEKKKITCVNEYDDTFFPEDFVYITKSMITADAHVDLSLSRIGDMHCACSGNCLTLTTPCKCTDDTRGEYAYDKDGLLIQRLATNYCYQDGRTNGADFITECTPICPCDMECGNRVVQRGLKCRLQVFRTKEGKGWGVRTLERILARSFLFEYIGEIMTNTEQYYRNEEYKGKNVHTYQMLLNADFDMETKHFKDGLNDDEALTLDATRYGNVSRFVNHRCEDPNMFIRPVQIDTRDTHYYHVAFFAGRDIDEMEELTWDYGIIFDDDHEVIGFRCLCGSSQCRDPRNKACQKI